MGSPSRPAGSCGRAGGSAQSGRRACLLGFVAAQRPGRASMSQHARSIRALPPHAAGFQPPPHLAWSSRRPLCASSSRRRRCSCAAEPLPLSCATDCARSQQGPPLHPKLQCLASRPHHPNSLRQQERSGGGTRRALGGLARSGRPAAHHEHASHLLQPIKAVASPFPSASPAAVPGVAARSEPHHATAAERRSAFWGCGDSCCCCCCCRSS